MPTKYRKCAPFSLPHNQSGLVGINKNNPCDGYFGCDDEESFPKDDKALLNNNNGKQHCQIPWIKRKSPPVLSFFKRMASLRKRPNIPAPVSNASKYRTLPNFTTKNFNIGYKCFPFDNDTGFTSLKRDYCCDGYFGCPPAAKKESIVDEH